MGASSADGLTPAVRRFISSRKKISCNALMKKYGIGYIRAARILSQLAAENKVSEAKPNRARRVL